VARPKVDSPAGSTQPIDTRPPSGAMDEILALQAQLEAVQATKPAFRFTERNVVDLVNKMIKLGYLEDTLMHTLDGKEYVTQDRLDAEIKREVKRAGGRIPVIDLQGILNLDVVHCERRAKALASDPSNGFSLVEGELMTPGYLDGVAVEVNEELTEAGVVRIGDLARKHELSADLMSRTLESRMGTLVHGRAEGGVLHTAGYVTRLTAQLRGAVRAALTPTTRETLVQHALVASTPAGAELTGSIVRDLANDAAVASGSFRGGAWHPTAYGRTKSFAVKEAYARDGLITTATARRLGVDNLGEYFNTELDPHGFALPNSFVSKSTLERLDDAVREQLRAEGWCECAPLLPPDLPAGDGAALLALAPVLKGIGTGTDAAARLVSELSVATEKFVEDVVGGAARELGARLGREEGARRQLAAATGTGVGTFAVDDSYDSDEDDHRARGKKGKNRAKTRKGKVGDERLVGPGAPTDADIAAVVASVAPDASAGFCAAVGDLVRPFAMDAFRSALASFRDAAEERTKESRAIAAAALDEALPLARLFTRGVHDVLDSDDAARRHCAKTHCVPCADLFLRSRCHDEADGASVTSELTAKERAVAVAGLPVGAARDAGVLLTKLCEQGDDPASIMSALDQLASATGVRLRPADKKTERTLLQTHRKGLEDKIAAVTDPAAALMLAMPLIFASTRSRAVAMTGRSLAAAIEAAGETSSLPASEVDFLRGYRSDVMASLTGGGDVSGLGAKLPTLRRIALECTRSKGADDE
jgi:E3 UFM1-protein ligase 1